MTHPPPSCDFPHMRPTAGSRPKIRIECHACDTTESFSVSQGQHSVSQETAERTFRNRRWTVGKDRRHDLCPSCTHERLAARRGRSAATKDPKGLTMPKPVNGTPADAPPAPALIAEAPRAMTKEDRRLVFAKINEVYLDERRGYENGWSDARVAADLGTPRAWVSAVREEHFGVESTSEEVRSLLEEARSFQIAALAKADWFEKALPTIREIEAALPVWKEGLRDLGKRLDAAEALFLRGGRRS